MLKKILAFALIAAMALSMFALSSCRSNNNDGGRERTGAMWDVIRGIEEQYPVATPTGTGVGGTLNFALVSANNFAGIHNPVFSILADDGRINDFMFTGLLWVDVNNFYTNDGPAWFEYSIEDATFTVHFHDDTAMYWWDGVPVTMYDVLFTYEMTAYPGTTSQRFGPALNTSTVRGIDAYREDPSVGISGIRVFNEGRSIEFSYYAMDPSFLIGAVWTIPMPRHHFEGIAMADIPDHENSRSNPLGNGAFMFDHSIPGEAISMVSNPLFWQGQPPVDRLNIEVIAPAMVGEAMRIGRFDMAEIRLGDVELYEPQLDNVRFISALDRRFDFMGFRHGFRDNDTGVITNNPDTYMNCIYLRRALGYARDDQTTALNLFGGFRIPISTTMIPWQGDFMYEGLGDGFMVFDLDKANQILDDAGYEWIEGEQFRRHNVTGEPFTLIWLIANNFTENEYKVPHHQQNWALVGLDVQLYQNRLVTLQERSDTLTHDLDGGAIHIYDATWMVGSNPNPTSLWGNSVHNATRYTSPELQAILDNINSEQAWDMEWLIEQYAEYQRYVYTNAPWIPVTTAVQIWIVNNRVLNFSLDRDVTDRNAPANNRWQFWDLSSNTAYVSR